MGRILAELHISIVRICWVSISGARKWWCAIWWHLHMASSFLPKSGSLATTLVSQDVNGTCSSHKSTKARWLSAPWRATDLGVKTTDLQRPSRSMFGYRGFLKSGYPESSFILMGCSRNKPSINGGTPMTMETSICLTHPKTCAAPDPWYVPVVWCELPKPPMTRSVGGDIRRSADVEHQMCPKEKKRQSQPAFHAVVAYPWGTDDGYFWKAFNALEMLGRQPAASDFGQLHSFVFGFHKWGIQNGCYNGQSH